MVLTQEEITRTRVLCFNNPLKACAYVQEMINSLQITSCSDYADLKGKKKRTVQYRAKKMIGFDLCGRRYLTYIQQ